LLSLINRFRLLKRSEHRAAWALAVGADALQIAVFPLFAAGGLSPADAALDLAVGALLTRLLGWHWAFLPSLLAELMPGFDLFPTWTAAVYFVTRSHVQTGDPEIETRPQTYPPEPEILPPLR